MQTRICKYTYGFGSSLPFNEQTHLPSENVSTPLVQVRCIYLYDADARIDEAYSVSKPHVEKSYGIGCPKPFNGVTYIFFHGLRVIQHFKWTNVHIHVNSRNIENIKFKETLPELCPFSNKEALTFLKKLTAEYQTLDESNLLFGCYDYKKI
ncbi:hypothetical protein KUTeg_024173 [Tegillarca granosa]|uniref:Uncharacterized protein n=1 Tax=Tegillarca granosa TaxID=220873 RepID=A0ABQ9E254_TEGGR|nr:hypothetical protein KUTeg_024173 [Tegillarca granosa]